MPDDGEVAQDGVLLLGQVIDEEPAKQDGEGETGKDAGALGQDACDPVHRP